MKWAILLLLCACASHRQEASQVDEKAQTWDTHTFSGDTEVHRTQEPSKTTTTIEEFNPLEEFAESNALGDSTGPVKTRVTKVPAHLVKRTTVVTERGQVTTETSKKADSSAAASSTATLAGKATSESSSRPSLGFGVLGLLVAGVGVWLVLTRGTWLPKALGLARRLLGL